uniref:Apolipoprotein M n=1 Tax=Electrophorus electricus TaxID=8005 RepID=A0A4W4GSG9_ELEEL
MNLQDDLKWTWPVRLSVSTRSSVLISFLVWLHTGLLWAADMFSSVLALIYAVAQVLMPCLPPVPLSRDVLATDQYLGKWYYVGVASWKEEDIEAFQAVDSSVVELKSVNGTLIMTGAMREGDDCITRDWTYRPEPEIDYVMDENVWDGKWIKCPSCLVFGKLHTDNDYIRFMLFARNEKSTELVERFKEKMGCFQIDKFIIAPQTKGMTKVP